VAVTDEPDGDVITEAPAYVRGVEFGGAFRDDALDVSARLIEHYRHKSTDEADEQWREPVRHYRDPDRWRAEVATIHQRLPLPVALTCELPEPGSYKAVNVAGTPVVVVRDTAGQVRASVNACRHRGAELVPEGLGSARRFTCPYHAWSYDLAGCLVGVAGQETFGPVDRPSMGLVQLPVEERYGLIFVSLDPMATIDLDAWLGPRVSMLLEGIGLERGYRFSTRTLPGPNWKLVVDGYLEGYHFAALHAKTVLKTNFSNMATFDRLGPHGRIAFALRSIVPFVDLPRSEWDPAACAGPILWLFPGLAIAGGWRSTMAVAMVLPGTTPGTSYTEQRIVLRNPPRDELERRAAEHAREWFHDVTLDEDYATGEGVQRGLAALGDRDFVFGRNELGVQHFHRTIGELVQGKK
jgi:nitrite reductase/ring-hydroxylating ferredoxin subunit